MVPEHLAVHLRPLEPVPTGAAPDLPARVNLEAVLFDVYGTLFISGSGDISLARAESRADDALAALLTKYGIDTAVENFRKRVFNANEADHARQPRNGAGFPQEEKDQIWQGGDGF